MKYRLMRRYARAHYCPSTGCWILRLHFGVKTEIFGGENGFFSTHNILIHIPIGAGGYDLSWIEAVGTIAGLLCIWLASLEKISNYFFGLVNVTLFAIIFFQIQLYASLLLQLFSLPPIFMAGMRGRGKQRIIKPSLKSAGCRCQKQWHGWRYV